MRHGIVEGEPGIFPQPIARLLQAIGRLFGRGRDRRGHGQDPGRPPVEDVAGVPDVSGLDPVRPAPDAGDAPRAAPPTDAPRPATDASDAAPGPSDDDASA